MKWQLPEYSSIASKAEKENISLVNQIKPNSGVMGKLSIVKDPEIKSKGRQCLINW